MNKLKRDESKKKRIRPRKTKRRWHGFSETKEYKIWCGIKKRVNNKNSINYKNYGGKGVTICKEWSDSFLAFYKDLGPIPSNKHSIDRINPEGNYEPSNCRWANSFVQNINKKRASKYYGIYFHNKRLKWVARIYINKDKTLHIGEFTNPKEAAISWDKVALSLRGKDAILNFPNKLEQYRKAIE